MQSNPTAPRRGRTLERVLASLALGVCVITIARIWQAVGAYQPLWPLPVLYFLEIVALSVLAWLALVPTQELSSSRIAAAWCVVGALSGFVVLGLWSIGLFLVPTVFLFALTALFAERRHPNLILAHLALCLLAGLVQAAVMFVIVALETGSIRI